MPAQYVTAHPTFQEEEVLPGWSISIAFANTGDGVSLPMAFRAPLADRPTAFQDASPSILFLDFHYGLKLLLVFSSPPAG